MSTYQIWKNDESMERTGLILNYNEAGKFKVARAGGANKAFTRKLKRLSEPYRRAILAGRMDEEVAERLLMEAFVETCLLDWEDVTGPDGKPLPFSKENAMQLLKDLPELWAELREDAQNATLFREEIREGDSGN